MSNRAALSRRGFIKVIGGVGASLMLGSFSAVSCADVPPSPTAKKGVLYTPNAFVNIDPDGYVTVTICRSDMGQGVRTSLAMLTAEELDADWSKVRVVQAPANPKLFGGQGTGGSGSIRSMHDTMRKIGAKARAALVAAAAKQWNVSPEACKTENGKVISPDGSKSIPYGDLTALAQVEAMAPTGVLLKDPSQFKLVGKGANRVDNHAVVTGTAIYGLDAKVDGMAYAVIARSPTIGANIVSVDDSAARQAPGVIDVFRVNGGVAVIATNTWAAINGRDALKITWSKPSNPDASSKTIREKLAACVGDHLPMPANSKVIEATFDLPFLAHATMEPMNAVADVTADRCVIWAPTQVPDSVQRMAARTLGLTQDKVEVNVTLLGGGFGRRLFADFVSEAIEVSKKSKKPIKLTWTREDDMRNDHYRGACHHSIKAALDGSGNPVAWSHQAMQAGGDASSRFDDAGIHYKIPNSGLRFGGADVGVPTGPWRSVENTVLNVVNECFMDELAHAAGKDPFTFRRDLIEDKRLRNVFETAAKQAEWDKPLPKGWGRGIACFSGYDSYAAHVVELSVSGNQIRVHRVVAVIDCGLAVNPKGVEAQVQGACVDGLSTSLRAAITIENGGVKEQSWTDYRWMTMEAMPKIEVHTLSGSEHPGGMGEVGYPSVPPAIANAIFAATGKRVRKFPIKIDELV